MRKIDFIQGYYEWNVYVDDKCIFTFEDVSDVGSYTTRTDVIDDYIDYILNVTEFEFTDEELAELRTQMIDKWGRHYIE